MEILWLTPIQAILFYILYGISGVVPLIAALYLLFRPCNAFSAEIKPPVRLRRWAAAFLGFSSLAHVWWVLFFVGSGNLKSMSYLLLCLTDSVLLLTTIAGTMLSMLQDRRRPIRPVLMALIPFLVLSGIYFFHPSIPLKQITTSYLLLICIVFTVCLVYAIRQYDRWLNDNYADLEHKKVWLSQLVAFFCILFIVLYIISENLVLIFCLHIVDLILIFLLVWRVETLPTLEEPPVSQAQAEKNATCHNRKEGQGCGSVDLELIEQLLKAHCVAPQLYLEHDLTLQQLALAIGTNRSYLSQFFSRHGITYNSYINNQRINHFVNRFHELTAAGESVCAQQLAQESGFRSYSTFSRAFTQRTGQSVTAWMREEERC